MHRSASTFPKFTGTIYELLSAPVSYLEIVVSYVGAAATKSVVLGLIILATAALLVPLRIEHPVWMILFLVLTSVTFSLIGFIIGIWADGFEKLQAIPLLIITPLTFLGGSFYSIDMLPPFWQTVSLFNPVVYLVSGFRWSFYGIADVGVGVSLARDGRVPRGVARRRGVDLQNRVSAEDIDRRLLRAQLQLCVCPQWRRAGLRRHLGDPDPEKSKRVMQAMLKKKKIDIEGLKKAYAGR